MPTLNISLKPDAKAVSRFESRSPMPIAMSSAEWAQVESAIREKCFFSARVNNAEILGKMRDFIGKAVDSTKRNPNEAFMSRDKFISEMKDFLRSKGYATGGTKLTDITSHRRLALIYQMNLDEAREYARYVRGQKPELLNAYPAWEFLRVEDRRVPRTNWRERWQNAGGKFYRGRMIALKNDEVWTKLSRFSRPYPPFDFGSGMGVEDIDRNETIELGLLPDDEPADEIPDFDCVLESEVSLERIPEDMRGQFIKDTPNAEIRGDKLLMRDKPKLPTWKDMGLESAKAWKHQGIKDKTIDSEEARKRLKKGEIVKDVFGEDATFNNTIITHWEEVGKKKTDIDNRLSRLDVAEEVVKKPHEIWQQGSQKMYIQIYEKDSGKIKGMAVAKQGDLIIRSYILNSPQGLDAARKGQRIYPK